MSVNDKELIEEVCENIGSLEKEDLDKAMKKIDLSEEEIIEYAEYMIKHLDFNKIGYVYGTEVVQGLLDLYNKEKEKNKKLFDEYNKRVETIIKYEQGIKSFLDDTNISDIEPWSEYKIEGKLLFDLQEVLEEE